MLASQAQIRGERGTSLTEGSDRSRSRRAKRTAQVKPVSNNQNRIELLRGDIGRRTTTPRPANRGTNSPLRRQGDKEPGYRRST